MINKELKKELTVIIPLKDRAPYTSRLMTYLDKIAFPFKVMLADGGKDKRIMEILLNKSNYPNVNYEYIRYPIDNTYADYYKKMVDALSQVKTPLVVMGDNDDFFNVQGIEKSIEFMCAHPDYSACRGEIFRFRLNPRTKKRGIEGLYGEINKCEKLYDSVSIVQNTASQRINDHFNNYVPTWYDVHRTDQLNRYFQILAGLNIKDIYLAELLISFLTITNGKACRGSYLYLLRQASAKGSTSFKENENNDMFDRMLLETWSLDFNKFTGAIAGELLSHEGIGQDEAIRAIKKLYRHYINPYMIKILSREVVNKSALVRAYSIVAEIFKRIFRANNRSDEIDPIRNYLRQYSD